MARLYSPKEIKKIQDKYKFNTSKSLGQNFLIDGNVVRKIREESNINENDTVLEVGPGLGTLTEELLMHAGKVIAIEIDKTLIPILKENFKDYNNFKLINDDVLKVDLEELLKDEESIKVVANLPYYVTSPIISLFIESNLDIDLMTFMVQKEVADRMVAGPGSKIYGSLSVFIQFYSDPRILMDVSRKSFMPSPNVDSAVVYMKKKNFKDIYSDLIIENLDFFFSLVHAAFNQRRKTILNSMSSNQKYNIKKDDLRRVFDKLSIDPRLRAEDLFVNDYINISQELLKEEIL